MTLEEARRVTKLGSTIAFVSAAVTAGLVFFATMFPSKSLPGPGGDVWNILDVLLLLALGWGVRRYSRGAAVTLLVYFVLSKTFQILEGEPRLGIVSLVMIYFFFNAVRGNFAYHRLQKENDPAYRRPGLWPWFVFVPAGVVLVALLLFGTLVELGHIPDSLVLRGEEIPDATRKTLVDYGLISRGEKLLFFYSAGVFSLLEDGNIVTDRRVISYEESATSLDIFTAPFDSILTAVIYQPGEEVDDTIIEITTTDGSNFWLYASKEDGRDRDFLQAIHSRIPKHESDVSFLR